MRTRSAPEITAEVSAARQRPTNGHKSDRGPNDFFSDTLGMMGAIVPYERNVEIFGEGEPAEYVYRVIEGAVRTYKVLQDGRRQVSSFVLPGDIFGLQVDGQHRFTAEAIADSTVLVVKRSTLLSLAARDAEFGRKLWTATAKELAHVQELMMTLGRKTAQERVAGFLLEMAERGSQPNVVDLPMSRRDIADYLGLTIETVSRTITQIQSAAAIALRNSRQIVLQNRAVLARMCG
jgi:CRP/FNR family nitrogen fixation transcriptional regulator